VEIRVIGKVTGHPSFSAQKLRGRLHTRTIICDGCEAFIGSQSLRPAELDSRRELGLIIRDAAVVKKLKETFESDWVPSADRAKSSRPAAGATEKQTEKTVQALERELKPLMTTVKQRVRKAVAKAGLEILDDKGLKNTVKRVVKKAVKDAVKDAVREAKAE
jgi:hypothetical protein